MQETKTTVAYLAGPMTGFEQFNFPAFDAAAQALRDSGIEVINPADMDREAGFDGTATELPDGFIEAAWDRDQAAVARADCVIVLPGWTLSSGAKAEVAIASFLKKPIYRYPCLRRLQVGIKVTALATDEVLQ